MKQLNSLKMLLCAVMMLIGANAWGYTLTLDFYDETKLSSTSGTDLNSDNYSTFVKVPTGQTATNVVTGITANGTVQYGKNGGLTVGLSSANNDHSVTFSLGSGIVVTKCTVYATKYESGIWKLNGAAAESGSLGTKGASIDDVTNPLIWDNLSATSLAFTKFATNGTGTQKRLTILRIVCTYTVNGELGVEDIDPTIAKTDATIAIGESIDVATLFTSNSTGAFTYTVSAAPESAVYTFNSPTFSASTHGIYTIYASQAAATGFNAGSRTATITVIPAERPSNKSLTTPALGCSYFDLTPGADNYAQPESGQITKTDGVFSIELDKGTATSTGSYPRADAQYCRIYNKNTVTVSVPNGWYLVSVEFVEPASNKSWGGGISVDNGFYHPEGKKWYATSDVASVKFTIGATNRVGSMILKAYNANYLTDLTVSTAQYATYYNATYAFTMPEGLEGIVVDAVDGAALGLTPYYQAGDVVPAGEPLIMHATTNLTVATIYDLYKATTTAASLKSEGDNLLSGTSTADEVTTGGDKYYRLSQHDGVVGFYYGAAEGAAFKPGANKAYLAISGSSAPAHFSLTDEATAVENVEATQDANAVVKFMENGQLFIKKNGVIYNAMGQIVK